MELLNENESDDELPAGWEERVTADGRIYYAKYNCFLFINIKKYNYKEKLKILVIKHEQHNGSIP